MQCRRTQSGRSCLWPALLSETDLLVAYPVSADHLRRLNQADAQVLLPEGARALPTLSRISNITAYHTRVRSACWMPPVDPPVPGARMVHALQRDYK